MEVGLNSGCPMQGTTWDLCRTCHSLAALVYSSPQGLVCPSQGLVCGEQGTDVPCDLPCSLHRSIVSGYILPSATLQVGKPRLAVITSQIWDPQVGPYPLSNTAAGEACRPLKPACNDQPLSRGGGGLPSTLRVGWLECGKAMHPCAIPL